MRQVTKTGRGAYPYDVDLDSQTDLENSLKSIEVEFGGKAKAKITEVWKTASPTALQVLNGLLLIAKADGLPPPKKKQKTAGPTLEKVRLVQVTVTRKLSQYYGFAAGPLEAQLGRFCSYCEHYYASGLAVEHVCPKAPYPFLYLAWQNFLIGCPVCNSSKLNKPPRDDAIFTPTPNQELGYFDKIKDHYMWPQWDRQAYRELKPQLEYKAGASWTKVTYPVDAKNRLTTVDRETRTLKADVLVLEKPSKKAKTKEVLKRDVPVRVVVVPTTTGATATLGLAGLNKPSYNPKRPGGEADIRLWARTEHWFKVLERLLLLRETPQKQFEGMWKMMMLAVPQPGLYSVWVAVIDALGPGKSWMVPGSTDSVMDRFLTEVRGADYFPGTDTDNTP